MTRTGAGVRRHRSLLVTAVAVMASAGLVWSGSQAAFTAQTGNESNTVASGSVVLTNDTSAATPLITGAGLGPGSTGDRCERVTYDGTLPAAVTLFASDDVSTGDLANHLDLAVIEGRGAATDCTDFVPEALIWSGTAAEFTTELTDAASGRGLFTPDGPGQVRTYRLVWTIAADTPDTAQGDAVGFDLRWQAVTADRSGVVGQGVNWGGQLGDGTTQGRTSPTPLVASPDDGGWRSLAHDDGYTCGIRGIGTLWCWGNSAYGTLGTGGPSTPLPVRVGSGSDWTHVSTSLDAACGLRGGGELWCWGHAANGLGYPTDVPVRVGNDLWMDVSMGTQFACAVRGDGTLWCWGSSESGRTGTGDANADANIQLPTPVQVGSVDTWRSLTTGQSLACGTRDDFSLWCWGDNGNGQLGVGDQTRRSVPTQVSPGTQWVGTEAGATHVCGVQLDGSLWCWGNESGLGLGVGSGLRTSPALVDAGAWATATAHYYFSCGLRQDRSVWCWGENGVGQLGQGDTGTYRVPTRVPGVVGAGISISGYADHTLFRTHPS